MHVHIVRRADTDPDLLALDIKECDSDVVTDLDGFIDTTG